METIETNIIDELKSCQNYHDYKRFVKKYSGIEDAVKMSSVNQAREFGLTQKGAIEVGKDADLNVLDSDLNVVKTFSFGRLFEK